MSTENADGECACEFDNEDDGSPGYHYIRACRACGQEWRALHCPHDGVQTPCHHCGWRDPGTRTPMEFLGFREPL